jgi:hypothetical protein
MKPGTQTFLQWAALSVTVCTAANVALGKDHTRIQEQRRRLGTQAMGPKQAVDEKGYLRWRHHDYLPDLRGRDPFKGGMVVVSMGEKEQRREGS